MNTTRPLDFANADFDMLFGTIPLPQEERRSQRIAGEWVAASQHQSLEGFKLAVLCAATRCLLAVTGQRSVGVLSPVVMQQALNNLWQPTVTSRAWCQAGLSKARIDRAHGNVRRTVCSFLRLTTIHGPLVRILMTNEQATRHKGFSQGLTTDYAFKHRPVVSLLCPRICVPALRVATDLQSVMLRELYDNPLDVTTWAALLDYSLEHSSLRISAELKQDRYDFLGEDLSTERIAQSLFAAQQINEVCFSNNCHVAWHIKPGTKVTCILPEIDQAAAGEDWAKLKPHCMQPGMIGTVIDTRTRIGNKLLSESYLLRHDHFTKYASVAIKTAYSPCLANINLDNIQLVEE